MDSKTVYSNRTTASLDVGSYYAYVIEGAILLFFNLFLALVIIITKRLRSQKEYIIIASNMLFDAAFGLAYFIAGIYRLHIYYTETRKHRKFRIFRKFCLRSPFVYKMAMLLDISYNCFYYNPSGCRIDLVVHLYK